MRFPLRPEVYDRLRAMAPPYHPENKPDTSFKDETPVWTKPRHETIRRWCKYTMCRRKHPDRPTDMPLKSKKLFCSSQCEDGWNFMNLTAEDWNRRIRQELEQT